MDLETLNNANAVMGALQQLQNTVTSIADMKNSEKQTQIAHDNLDFNKLVSAQNFTMQNNQFEYQKQLNDKIMEREDNAMQRQVADLQKAGLSPLMVTNGANATPLTSATAPQKDTSGINQAIQNMTSAYNDYYTRRLNRQNFALQNRVQTAQSYTQLAESKLQLQKMNIEKQILDTDLKYYKSHPERNLGIQQALLNIISLFLDKNGSSAISELKDNVKKVLEDSGISSPTGDIVTYGLLPPDSKYNHNFDSDNYDLSRSTPQIIKQETKEKYYKFKLKKNDTLDLRTKLYKTDDYLKKHISLENWLKMNNDFLQYYLKYGQFEGHKKYFE